MNYYIDTEFLEGPQKEKFPISLFRKETKPTIDLISIGIVSEDGREYYAISKDFNLDEAWNRFDLKLHSGDRRNIGDGTYKVYWIRENVLKPIWRELIFKADECWGMSNKQTEVYYKEILTGAYDHYFSFKSLKALIEKYGKTYKDIAEEIKEFCGYDYGNGKYFRSFSNVLKNDWETNYKDELVSRTIETTKPVFYAYYADYDWVAFCWLFGKMMDLPKGFPMYCRDLKQIVDESCERITFKARKTSPNCPAVTHESMKNNNPLYPKQENEHNALADARWNKKLYEFLKQL